MGKRVLLLADEWHDRYDMLREGLELLEGSAKVERLALPGTPQEPGAAQEAAVLERLAGADALIVGPWRHVPVKMTPQRLDALPALRVICGTWDNRFGEWIDVADAVARRITIVDTSRSMTSTVAECGVAMTLNLLRDIPRSIQLVRQGKWRDQPFWDVPGFVYGDLAGKRVGLAGLGSINRHYAAMVAGFGCRLTAFDPFVEDGVFAGLRVGRAGSLEALAAGSDIFVVGIPPLPSTQKIIGRSVFDAMPAGALFVLLTRMAVVEQDGLWDRVASGTLRAAIDVWQPEPPPEDAWMRTHPNVLATPHIASNTIYCHRRCFATAAQDLVAVLDGRQAVYAATPWDAACYAGRLGR